MKVRFYVVLFFIAICVGKLFAQESLTSNINEVFIHSKILNQERNILVYSTVGKPGDKNDFPTVYLLDGKENFLLTAGIISNLVRAELLPNLNLIGINNYDYDREFDLSSESNSEEIYFKTGGELNFQRFLAEELFLYIDSIKTTSSYRILIGHSLGGSFGLNMMKENPTSFSSAILIDPSLWWNNGELIESIKTNGKVFSKTRIYLTRSENDSENIDLFEKLSQLIQSEEIKFKKFPEENHISTLTPAIYHGLKYLFKEYSSLDMLYAKKDFDELKEKLDELSVLYNTTIIPNPRIIAPIARNFTNKGEFIKSIEILKYLKDYHPQNIMVLNFLGEAYEKSRDLSNAKLMYNQSLEIAKAKGSPMVKWIEKRLSAVATE